MSYKKWHDALLNYYFNDNNKDKEIILYADKELIDLIGQENNLGSYNNFIKDILLDFNEKIKLFDTLFYNRRGVEENRVLKKEIIDFPNLLNSINRKNELWFFNYVIFYITVYVENDQKSFYNFLNQKIISFLPKENQKITNLKGLDLLFDTIEKWSSEQNKGVFRSRRIGKLSYLGLLQYQVILKPFETQQLEEILYKYQIQINDNAIYPEFINKILPFVEYKSLKDKLINAIKEPVAAEWFINKTINFNFYKFSKTHEGKQIEVFRKAKLVYKINDKKELCLVTDMLPNIEEEPIGFKIENSGKDINGYYSEPISIYKKISFEPLILATKNNLTEYNTLKINDINFFYKSENVYLQTLHHQPNCDVLVVVNNKDKVIKAWEKWSENKNNVQSSKSSSSLVLNKMFGDNYVFYTAKNVLKSFYKNKELVYTTNYKDTLNVKILGGIKFKRNIYLDTGLPFFHIIETNFKKEEYSFKVIRNGTIDSDFIFNCIDDKVYLYLNNEITINETSLVIIKITNKTLKIEKSFDFLIKGTKLKTPDVKDLIQYNNWGDINLNSKNYLKGHNVFTSSKIKLESLKHQLGNLKNKSSDSANYFIYILCAIFYNEEKNYINNLKINKAIDTVLGYLKARNIQIIENKYSRYNLIKNLISLGYINSVMDKDLNIQYQLLPHGIKKIEKSFKSNGGQVFQIIGARSRYMMQKINVFCEENGHTIKYKCINKEKIKSLENVFLPELIYIEIKGGLEEYKNFIKENFDIDLYIEDKYHLGDTLLNMSASIDLFEKEFLGKELDLANHSLRKTKEDTFPRIREGIDEVRFKNQNSKQLFLEQSLNKFYKIKNKSWTNLYIANKKSKIVLVMARRWNGQKYIYSPEVLIPSKIKLPSLIHKSFCQINHGVPATRKVFIKNIQEDFKGQENSFMYFDQYKFSDKLGRRERIAKVLTGSDKLEENPQIIYAVNQLHCYKMEFIQADLYSDRSSVVVIKEDLKNKIIAIITSNKEVFVSNEFTEREEGEVNFRIDHVSCRMLKIKKQKNSLNWIITKILDKEDVFEYIIPLDGILVINSEYTEEILIKELH